MGCLGHSHVCTLEYYSLPAYICSFSLDNPCTRRSTPFQEGAPSQKQKTCIIEELKCKSDEFILTWSERKFVSSSEAPRINSFSKWVFLPFG
jgi:hypothetical protein